MAAGSEVVFDEVNLGLYDRKFVAEVAQAVIEAAVAFDLSRGFPMLEIGNGGAEGVEGRSGAIEQGVEPTREWLSGASG
jgi:hypothetical protein